MSIEENNLNSPSFKQTDAMKIEKTKQMLKDFLPLLTDEDYFLDKKDSVVYSYLMNEKVNRK